MKYYKRARFAKYITTIICSALMLGLYSAASSAIDTATTIRFFIDAIIIAPIVLKGIDLFNWFDDAQENNLRKINERNSAK